MIDGFEVGKYYRWVGPKTWKELPVGLRDLWNYTGQMNFILDGKPRKCVFGFGSDANFKGNLRDGMVCAYWSWGKSSFDYFVECKEMLNLDFSKLRA